ncbi:MAG: HAMP domain-containing histidine kinase [Planctomycetes bacterium]|nr:HAMP domain-containing histidine kinase [Planctomycetota bacterium]
MLQKRYLAPLAFLVAATGLVWLWQWLDYRSFVRAELEADSRYGEVILAGADGAMHRQCRRRALDLESLQSTLEDVRSRVGATYLALLRANGETFAAAGTPEAGAPLTQRTRLFRFPEGSPGGPGPGRGGLHRGDVDTLCADCPLPGDLLELRLEYPADRLDSRIAAARRRFLAVGGALTLAFASLFLFYRGRLRAAELRAELAAAAEKVRSLEFLGRLGAGLAHETRNPLGAVRGFAEMLARGNVKPEEVQEAAARIVDETDRIVARLDEFMLLSRPSRPNKAEFDLKELLEDLAGLIRLELAPRNAALAVTGDAVRVTADREQVRRLFMNLLVNAADALGEDGRIEVALDAAGPGARVMVTDNGCGVPESIRATLFEPYVTAKAGGTGLGLAIARRIAAEHGWRIRYEPGSPHGTRIVVEVPA